MSDRRTTLSATYGRRFLVALGQCRVAWKGEVGVSFGVGRAYGGTHSAAKEMAIFLVRAPSRIGYTDGHVAGRDYASQFRLGAHALGRWPYRCKRGVVAASQRR